MKELIYKIKYKRLFTDLDKILDKCYIDDLSGSFYIYEFEYYTKCLFYIYNGKIGYYKNALLSAGMSKDISEEQLLIHLNERYIK